MTRPKLDKGIRLNLILTKEQRNQLGLLQKSTGVGSLSKVVQRAIVLYQILLEQQQHEKRVLLVTKDGSNKDLIIL